MANKTKIVVGQSSVTAGQMSDFWRKVGDGTIGSSSFQAFLENPHRFTPEQVTIVRAVSILGAAKVITAEQSVAALGLYEPQNLTIRYSEEVLRQCATSNRENGTDFRLVYLHGYGLRGLRVKFGTDKASQPCVYSNDWWLKPTEDAWANENPGEGYHLIDFNGRFPRTSWDNQETRIAETTHYERAHEAQVAEAVLVVFKTTGERLLPNWYHWGRSLDADGSRVCVGNFGAGGLNVSSVLPLDDDNVILRVCLLRKFAY